VGLGGHDRWRVLPPRKFVATSIPGRLRLAAITGGGTCTANAASNAAAAALACAAVCSAWAAVVVIHATLVAAAAAIDADA
jgi:hypothetical protein